MNIYIHTCIHICRCVHVYIYIHTFIYILLLPPRGRVPQASLRSARACVRGGYVYVSVFVNTRTMCVGVCVFDLHVHICVGNVCV